MLQNTCETMPVNPAEPVVSVIMANYNGAAHIAAAVRSVLGQSLGVLELILSDDGSNDDSLARARAAAGGDPRLVIVHGPARSGPAAARNRALEAARGRWIAIVDNDDFIHPDRLKRLIAAAEGDDADIAADDLLTFYEDGAAKPHAHLRGALTQRPRWISAAAYEHSNRMLGPGPALGYLKPVFRRSLGARYEESLRIGEDSDLIVRLLAAGARLRLYPDLGYFYRKHGGSISHRLNLGALDALLAANARIIPGANAALARELAASRRALLDARAFTQLIGALKRRDLRGALGAAAGRPAALLLLRDPIAARLKPKPRAPALEAKPRVTLLSRQRIVGATNGSSAYVLALAGALNNAGYAVDYVGASPKIFGRWAAMRLRPDVNVFDRYLVHGGWRVGPLVIAKNPVVWIASGLAVADRLLARAGLKTGWSKPAEYAQGAAATREDMLFVAGAASQNAAAVLCDYAFIAPLAPYALAPAAPRLIIMHDLMSARVADKTEQNVVEISAAEEFALLAQADAVVAIQKEEAAAVAAALPASAVLLAQHAVTPVSQSQPGQDGTLLFVGSNTAPNVVGLQRFFDEIWPLIRAKCPKAGLKVAGSVSRALGAAPEGVSMLGVVGDLEPLYAEAGVVISPLFTGSGLKIKLVEALAAGKAVVGTTVTAQGVEDIVPGAMVIADDARGFADACIRLLQDRAQRAALAGAALSCARAHFSADACFAPLIAYVRGDIAAPGQKTLQAAAAQSQ